MMDQKRSIIRFCIVVRELIVVTINNTDVYIHNDYHMLGEYKLNDNHYKCGIER